MSILIMNKIAYSKSPYDVWLQDLNEDLLVLTTPERAKECTNYRIVEAFDHYETNAGIEIRALELFEIFNFRAIIVTSEFDLLRAARLRELLGIKGQSLESAVAFRDKTVMKEHIRKAGLSVPHFAKIDSSIDLYQFIQQHGYPVVVKPVDGLGSRNTAVLSNRNDLMDYLKNGLASNLEVETFIEGEMYHIDGLVLNGELVHCWPSKYTNGCLAFKDGMVNGSYFLDVANPLTPRLIKFTTQVLEALPTPENTSFHAEVFHTPDDELIFCEIACRTGGGLIREAIQQGFGFDINKVVAQAQCGLDVKVPFSAGGQGPQRSSGWLLIPPKRGILRKIPTERYADWVTKTEISAKPNQEFRGAFSSVDTIARFLVEGESEVQVRNRIQELADWFEHSVVWEQ